MLEPCRRASHGLVMRSDLGPGGPDLEGVVQVPVMAACTCAHPDAQLLDPWNENQCPFDWHKAAEEMLQNLRPRATEGVARR